MFNRILAIGLLMFIAGALSMWDGGSAETYVPATNWDKVLMWLCIFITVGIGYFAGREHESN